MTGSLPRLSVVVPTFNNVAILRRCLDSWERFGGTDPYELIVIEDGCRDDTAAFLAERSTTAWGQRHLRWVHESNVHELRATNRGLSEARAPVALTWHDDMFLLVDWFIPELLASFERYDDIGLFSLSRGLLFSPCEEPMLRWEDAIDWRRQQSTIGPAPWNWIRACEVDGVIRPWAVRRACLDRVGLLDEAFVPTGWDESDLAFRITPGQQHVREVRLEPRSRSRERAALLHAMDRGDPRWRQSSARIVAAPDVRGRLVAHGSGGRKFHHS
jgi:glycosyltransferase involved in cell wall biosynthesis